MKNRLTKTAYLNFLNCPQEFWLAVHQPELFKGEPVTLDHEHLRQQGYAVEQYVKQLAKFQPNDNITVDFQRTFQTADLEARSDLIVTDTITGEIDIYEVKSSGSVKNEYYEDVAFQKIVAERSGSKVGRSHVITMNGDYVRQGEIDVELLFTITDVTDTVAERIAATETLIQNAIDYLDSEPVPSLVDYCIENKLDCRFIKLHFPNIPEYTVFDITRLNHDKRRQLLTDGIVDITDVPDGFKLSSKQQLQVTAAKTGEIVIDHEEIAKRINSWNYPLHFLDYETFSYAIPQFNGIKPFQQMCFQYSLHTIENPGEEPKHSYFLSHGNDDPPRAMAEKLKQDMSGDIGTVFVWYEPFEKGRNTEMGEMFPEFADFFADVNSKIYDLMKIFSDSLYIHPNFKGKTSIKKVMPVLVPSLSYKELGIGDGGTASIKWYRAATWDNMDAEEREQIFNDLEIYCHLDTLAMVEIFNVLKSLS